MSDKTQDCILVLGGNVNLYLLDGQQRNLTDAIRHLLECGFTRQEAAQYLQTLPRKVS